MGDDSDRELGMRSHRPGASPVDDGFSGRRRRSRDFLMSLEFDRFQAIDQLVSSFSCLFGSLRDRLPDSGVIVVVYRELSMHGDQSFARCTLTRF
ncbi:hypothetical protein [Candidatus Mycobacterium methanotrophicum]|uniref:Uncharacterized protein n=1 Tax=Candidatus Mycobacterium methanotrophicum TaxID=2943498 RepID=A0ABY4QKN7_9MYCO|nr:hypothetical protein [Candidatus Mycobacterium methanotrophicum]UQX11414.1 hypothetical protein M5I08_02505 [Candidatus Mycobacterium methanotrophicum]